MAVPSSSSDSESDQPPTSGAATQSLAYEIETPLGLGRFAPFQYERAVQLTRIRLFWRRIVAWFLVIFLVAWICATSGLFFYVKYGRGFSEVHYMHMLLLPWKIDDYRRTKGEAWVKEGLNAAEVGDWRKAFELLRGGLHSVPEAKDARLMLARIYLMAGRSDMARETLLGGLPYHSDELAYLRTVLGFLFEQQADAAVVELTTELGGRLETNAPTGRMVATARAFALFNRDAYAEAESVFGKAGLGDIPEARFVAARIAWEKGRREEALAMLRALHAQIKSDEEIYRTLVYYLREAGQVGEARRVAFAHQLEGPERVEPRLDFIGACLAAGDEEVASEAEAEYLERFADDALALLRLADFAVKQGRADTAWRVAGLCRDMGKEEAASMLIAIQAELERRDYAEALRRINQLLAEEGSGNRKGGAKWTDVQRQSLAGLRAVAFYGTGQTIEGESALAQVRATRGLGAATMTLLARQLERVAPPVEAEKLLKIAVERDPLYQPALVALLRTLLKEGDLSFAGPWIERLAESRKPPADLLGQLVQGLGSDRYLLMPERSHLMTKLDSRRR